ncbi:uncharacterized protein N7469_000584 [Penicillium citrinum]|uniref:DDE-1 domain-containing protein n=1 Tax=Penicillium citrinum TaxID=5077 RepID=A0A9W9TUU1_PENCI|nr:uncharacterized protein N7469_000584 [Penicillium citrinum]KAJ5242257.1 hypothetical protein N7469_000584 [Penicillium citrinum]
MIVVEAISAAGFIKEKYCLLILDSHSSYLIPQFDKICAENTIILLYIPAHLFYLLQFLNIDCFAVLKYIYSCLITNQIRLEYNYIDKLDFLAEYPQIYSEIFKTQIIEPSFRAADLVLLDSNYILSKLDISLRIPTSLSTQSSSQSSQFIRYDQGVTIIDEDLPTPAKPTQPVEPPTPPSHFQLHRLNGLFHPLPNMQRLNYATKTLLILAKGGQTRGQDTICPRGY